jgi:hypothetical protein
MTNQEYIEIFKASHLIRSPIVRVIEQQIQTLMRLEKSFHEVRLDDLEAFCLEQSEIAKWDAISMAEYEQKYGEIDLSILQGQK